MGSTICTRMTGLTSLAVLLCLALLDIAAAQQCADNYPNCCDKKADCAQMVNKFQGLCYNKKIHNVDWDTKNYDGFGDAWNKDGGDCCFSCFTVQQKGETGDKYCMYGNREQSCKKKSKAECGKGIDFKSCCEVCGYLAP